MDSPIRILAAGSFVARSARRLRQTVSFFLRVRSGGFGKRVFVHFCAENLSWQVAEAVFAEDAGDGSERWVASASFFASEASPLPGDVTFAAELSENDSHAWDNNFARNYTLPADGGYALFDDAVSLLVLPQPAPLSRGERALHLEILARESAGISSVRLHWTRDRWATSAVVPAHDWRLHAFRRHSSAAPNPNRHGVRVFSARLPVFDAYRVEFAAEARDFLDRTRPESAFYGNHRAERGTIRVMTLNLHTWQEENQLEKFATIARAIRDEAIDIVCFQEAAENWNGGAGDWESNAANIINRQLPEPFHLHYDFSHIGFDRYREGLAILSRFPFRYTDSGYVSDNTSIHSIDSRRVVMAQVAIPFVGPVNVFSAHLSWPSGGFSGQFARLRAWAEAKASPDVAGTFLCGDFNIACESASFKEIVDAGGFEEQLVKCFRPDAYDAIFRRGADSREVLAGDGRIDYIWLSEPSALAAVGAEELFTPARYGRVSDHTGYRVEFTMR
jgi:maltose 6'-phosphate phosphatase